MNTGNYWRNLYVNQNLPKSVQEFKTKFPEVWKSFEDLGNNCHTAGPLDEKTRRLVKVALAVGAGLEGATHSAVRNALTKGISPEEIMHVAILAITTLGFPSAIRSTTWISDEIDSVSKS